MAGSVNKAIILGNLGADPDVRQAKNGNNIVNFPVATSVNWKDKNTGERKSKTEWHRVVVFNEKLGEVAEKYLKKGSKVYLEGALQTRKWQGNDGVVRYTTEVVLENFRGELVLLDSKGSGGPPPNDGSYYDDAQTKESKPKQEPSYSAVKGGSPLKDDEIPW